MKEWKSFFHKFHKSIYQVRLFVSLSVSWVWKKETKFKLVFVVLCLDSVPEISNTIWNVNIENIFCLQFALYISSCIAHTVLVLVHVLVDNCWFFSPSAVRIEYGNSLHPKSFAYKTAQNSYETITTRSLSVQCFPFVNHWICLTLVLMVHFS